MLMGNNFYKIYLFIGSIPTLVMSFYKTTLFHHSKQFYALIYYIPSKRNQMRQDVSAGFKF